MEKIYQNQIKKLHYSSKHLLSLWIVVLVINIANKHTIVCLFL